MKLFLLENSSKKELQDLIKSLIDEPKRKTSVSIKDIGILLNGGIENIKAVYNAADDEEKQFWGNWYFYAKDNVNELAQKYGLPHEVMAAVVAVLSPGNKWVANLSAANKLVAGYQDAIKTGADLKIKTNAYPDNIKKAIKILQTGNTDLVTGPKVTIFFNSLIDPPKMSGNLVLDGHAINIWRGDKRPLKGIRITKAERQKMLEDYMVAAEQLGVPVQSVQAVTWYIWKYTDKSPSEMPSETIAKNIESEIADASKEEANLKEDISKLMRQKRKELLGRLGYKFVSKNYRLGSDSYIQPDDPQPERSKKLINMANKNIEKGNPKHRDMLHDPPSVGISLPIKKKRKKSLFENNTPDDIESINDYLDEFLSIPNEVKG